MLWQIASQRMRKTLAETKDACTTGLLVPPQRGTTQPPLQNNTVHTSSLQTNNFQGIMFGVLLLLFILTCWNLMCIDVGRHIRIFKQ